MKRLVVALLLASTLCMTGCGDTKKTEPAASTTEEVDKASSTMKEQMGDNAVLPSDSVKRVMAKQWKVIGTDTVYDLKEDGTGTKDDTGLTFECGFDEDNNITIKITMDGEEEGKLYAVTTDDTGYGVVLESLDGGKDIKLLQADTELLDLTDDRAKGLIGKWTDNSGNEYKLKKDGKLVIKSSSGETKGTYCVAENADGTLAYCTVSTDELVGDDAFAWHLVFQPQTCYYLLRNAKSGKYFTFKSGSIKTAKVAEPGEQESFHLMRGRVPVILGVGNQTLNTKGYWICEGKRNMETPPALQANGEGGTITVANQDFTNSATSQRWVFLTADQVRLADEGKIAVDKEKLRRYVAGAKEMSKVPHHDVSSDASASLRLW